RYLDSAASAGFIPAQVRLAKAYEADLILPNMPLAVHWYREAAKGGDSWAQTRLSHLYFQGTAGPADLVLAFEWLNLAVMQDYQAAKAFMKSEVLPAVFSEADNGRPWGQHAKGLAYSAASRTWSLPI